MITSHTSRERALSEIDSALSRIEGLLTELKGEGPDSGFAFRKFMDSLRPAITRLGTRVEVVENSAFMQIRSAVNGHRIYISKGKVVVGRIDSTIPLGYVEGSVPPKHHNGNIRSWIPADTEAVSKAIELLGMSSLPEIS